MILGRAFMPDATLGAPRYLSLLSPGGWSLYGLAAIVLFVVFPLLHLTVPADSALHISEPNQRVLLHRGRSRVRRALELYLTST